MSAMRQRPVGCKVLSATLLLAAFAWAQAPGSPTRASRGGVEVPGSPTRASRGGVEAPSPPSPQAVRNAVRDYRQQHEVEIVRGYAELLSLPNVASDTANIHANAERIKTLLQARG